MPLVGFDFRSKYVRPVTFWRRLPVQFVVPFVVLDRPVVVPVVLQFVVRLC